MAARLDKAARAVRLLSKSSDPADPLSISFGHQQVTFFGVGNQAKFLVDTGGGSYHRFGQSQAKLEDLSLVGISHLHPDHVSDLPAILWLSHRTRKEPLPIIGPSGNETAPSFSVFLSRLFDEKTGAYQVLGPTLSGTPPGPTGGGVRLEVGVVDAAKIGPTTVFDREGFTVTAGNTARKYAYLLL